MTLPTDFTQRLDISAQWGRPPVYYNPPGPGYYLPRPQQDLYQQIPWQPYPPQQMNFYPPQNYPTFIPQVPFVPPVTAPVVPPQLPPASSPGSSSIVPISVAKINFPFSLPFNATADTFSVLYTPQDPTVGKRITFDTNAFANSTFNSSLPTRYIIHGWLNDHLTPYILDIKTAYLEKGDFNVVSFDFPGKFHEDFNDFPLR